MKKITACIIIILISTMSLSLDTNSTKKEDTIKIESTEMSPGGQETT